MGVKNLWKLLEPYGVVESVRGRRLAVDTSIWMHQLSCVSDQYLPYVITRRIVKLLCNQLTPIFVFDGGVPPLKQKSIRRRRENALRLAEEKCHLCGSTASVCIHRKQPSQHVRDAADAETMERIQNHGLNWGELSEELDEDSDLCEYKNASLGSKQDPSSELGCVPEEEIGSLANGQAYGGFGDGRENPFVNPISLINEDSFDDMPRSQRLRKLVEMRQYRRLPMGLETSSSSAFSLSQVENVKKRNMVRRLIDKISNDGYRRVQSNWKQHIRYEKEPVLNAHHRYGADGGSSQGSSIDEAKEEELDVLLSVDGLTGGASEQPVATEDPEDRRLKSELFEKYTHLSKHGDRPDITSHAQDINSFSYKLSTKQPRPVQKPPMLPSKQDDPLEWMHSMAAGEMGTDASDLTYRSCKAYEKDDLFQNTPGARRSVKFTGQDADALQNQLVNGLVPLDGGILKIHRIIKTILDIFNICFIDSPEESDSQCAFLYKSNIVDGIITEDNDLILHGATVYRNFFSKSKPVTVYTFESISRGLSLSQTGLIKLSFLLGSDYTPGVHGIGIKKALAKVESVPDDDIAEIERAYTQSNVCRIGGFQNGSVDRQALAHYLSRSGMPREKTDELLFYVSTIKSTGG